MREKIRVSLEREDIIMILVSLYIMQLLSSNTAMDSETGLSYIPLERLEDMFYGLHKRCTRDDERELIVELTASEMHSVLFWVYFCRNALAPGSLLRNKLDRSYTKLHQMCSWNGRKLGE